MAWLSVTLTLYFTSQEDEVCAPSIEKIRSGGDGEMGDTFLAPEPPSSCSVTENHRSL